MKNDNLTFEAALKKLEDASSKLESGTLTLDESITEFEECIKLIKLCESKLSSAKQKVKILVESEDGTVYDTPFVPVESDEN